MELGFPHHGGRCRPEGTPFSPPVCLFFEYIEVAMDRGWDTIVPGRSWLYNIRAPANYRSAGRRHWGFPHCAGRYNPGDISVFVPGLSELYICERIMTLGMDPIVPR